MKTLSEQIAEAMKRYMKERPPVDTGRLAPRYQVKVHLGSDELRGMFPLATWPPLYLIGPLFTHYRPAPPAQPRPAQEDGDA